MIGGTKLEVIALDPETNEELVRNRIDSPKDDYQEILDAVCGLISDTAGQTKDITVGIGMPGSLSPLTELVQVSNKVLEGKDVKTDIQNKLGIEVKIANNRLSCIIRINRRSWKRLQLSFCCNFRDGCWCRLCCR